MPDILSTLGPLLSLLGGYLLGSIPFAVLVSRLMGLRDPRNFGSGNPGATNVLRSGNKAAAILTLLGDAAKGWAAVALAAWCVDQGWLPALAIPLAGLGAVLGHMLSVFLKFRGGKGVATALGVLLALQPWLALATVLTFLVLVFSTRLVSLASILAAVFAPFYYILGDAVVWHTNAPTVIALVLISVLIINRHKANINRLLAGTESRLGTKKKP